MCIRILVELSSSRREFISDGVTAVIPVAPKASNLISPAVNCTLGRSEVVCIPSPVASNGGEVSFGGQHSALSPSGLLVVVKLFPGLISFSVPVLVLPSTAIVIL